MSDPLSISASVAGLVTLVDVVFNRTVKYVNAAKGAKEDISALCDGLQSLSEVLHSLALRTSRLEAETPDAPNAYRPQLVHSCSQLLRAIRVKLDKHDLSESGLSRAKTSLRQLKWPFSASEVKEMLTKIENYKSTISLGLSADTLNALHDVWSAQRSLQNDIQDIQETLNQQRQEFEAYLSSIASREEREKIFGFFGSESPEARHRTSVELRHPETGIWLLEDDDFQSWMKGDHPKIWLSGIPGAGKTVLASAVIEETRKHSEVSTKAIAYFYCDYKDDKSQDPVKVFGSIATQLARQSVESFQILRGLYQNCHPPARTPTPPEVFALIDAIRQMTTIFQDVFIVVDGLDECGKNTIQVTKSLSNLNALVRSGDCAKIALLSRDEEDIRRLLVKSFVHVRISARSEDLRLYVAAEMEDRMMDGRLEINNVHLKDDILTALVEGADGM